MEEKDLREGDNETLNFYGILGDWTRGWENELYKIEHSDKNQEKWSLSKRSYVFGFLRGLLEKEKQVCFNCGKVSPCGCSEPKYSETTELEKQGGGNSFQG